MSVVSPFFMEHGTCVYTYRLQFRLASPCGRERAAERTGERWRLSP